MRFDLAVSPALLTELEDVLLRPKFLEKVTADDVRAYVEALSADGLVFPDPAEPDPVTADPDDDYIVALAIEAGT